jgi:hypothetical protein
MKKILALLIMSITAFGVLGIFSGCKNNDPSIMKIFVRSESNELLEGAQVVIIGDPSSNPPTNTYVDTLVTNASGYAEFNMDKYFSNASEDNQTGYFDVIAKDDTKTGSAYVRCRAHLTTVETIFLMN